MIYDSHCHLDLMDNMTSIVQSISKENVGILSVGTTPRAYLKEAEMFGDVKNIYVALGLHPQLVGSGYDDLELFESLAQRCHYIGEVGLDFSRGYITNKEQQIDVFKRVLLCCERYCSKVVSIHSLKAAATVLKILSQVRVNNKNTYILHWFTGTINQMQKAVDMGCFFSINPQMLKTKSGINLIQKIPSNKILLETDAPFTLKLQSIKQLDDLLQCMVDNISTLKGVDIRNQLVENSKMIYMY